MYACHGWQITTTEGIGNSREGFHPIQEKLADNNGSQCGWCSPGMVMSMYRYTTALLYHHLIEDVAFSASKKNVTYIFSNSYLENTSSPKASDIEGLFDGNICRCTGYRAILSAMQSFVPSDQVCLDIEVCISQNVGIEFMIRTKCISLCLALQDVTADKTCRKSGGPCRGSCRAVGEPVHVVLRDADWYTPASLQQLYDVMKSHSGKTLHLLMGNTASGGFGCLQYNLLYNMVPW